MTAVVLDAGRLPAALVQAQTCLQAGDRDAARRILDAGGLAAAQRCLAAEPGRVDIPYLLAHLQRDLGDAAAAVSWYERALRDRPQAVVFHELASLYRATGLLVRARRCREQALALEPDNLDVRHAYGLDLIRTGRTVAGLACLEAVLRRDPDHTAAQAAWLFHAQYLPDLDRARYLRMARHWARGLTPGDPLSVRRRRGGREGRRLRIGYLSPDFRRHSVAATFEPVLSAHDHERFEIVGYGSVAAPDAVTTRIAGRCDRYVDVHGWEDAALAERIAADGVDILVHLGGPVGGHRLGVLARRPAPVQMDWGAPATLGMDAVGFRVTDAWIDPPGSQCYYAERLLHLGVGFHRFRPPEAAPPVGPCPGGPVTFGSCNSLSKLNDVTVALWSRVLQAVSGSRLLLKFRGGDEPELQAEVRARFEAQGIAAERIGLLGRRPWPEALSAYHGIDIGLDPLPFQGCVTTLEALWMGVPVISLTGERAVARVGPALLNRVGLAPCVARDPADYVARARALAANVTARMQLRTHLRARLAGGELCDGVPHTRALEGLYTRVWTETESPAEEEVHGDP